jgi:hypothetical protein
MPTGEAVLTPAATPLVGEQISTNTPILIPATPTPTAPYNLPTAINPPHPAPTRLGRMNAKESSQLYEQRVKDFEGTLRFSIKISDVRIHQSEDITQYLVIAEGRLTNISNKPIVVRKRLSTGFTLNEDVSWDLLDGSNGLSYFICCIDIFGRYLSPDDYVLLQPNEFQNYLLPFELPFKIHDTTGVEVSLSGKRITLTANYIDVWVGYNEVPSGDGFKYIDMNSWVGRVQSNPVEYVFP